MATRSIVGGVSAPPVALDAALAVILAQPPAALVRITARLIERLDAIEGDADDEPEEDCCPAGDDDLHGEAMPGCWRDHLPGDPDDAEEDRGRQR
jgi:hypothetical protein